MSENETQLPESPEPEQNLAHIEGDDGTGAPARPQDDSASGDTAEDSQGAIDEGDLAADYLEELLDIVDLDGDIDIEVRDGRTYLSILTEDGGDQLDDLVGPRGEVLDALQELTRLVVLTATGERTRLVLDIAGHRERRQGELKDQAEDAIAKVRERGEDVHMEPMSAYERKIVHDFVAEAGLLSESEGEGKRRHVVISAS